MVQELAPARENELRHHDRDGELGVRGQRAEVAAERIAEVAVRSLDDLERHVDALAIPVALDAPGLGAVDGEADGPRIRDAEGARVLDRLQRRRVHRGDEHPGDDLAGESRQRLAGTGHERDVGDRDPELAEKTELQGEGCAPSGDRVSQRRPLEELRNHDRHDVGLAARARPDVVENGLDGGVAPLDRHEGHAAAHGVPGARVGRRLAVAHEDGLVRATCDLLRVPGRELGRRVERVHVEHDPVPHGGLGP